MHVGRYSNGVPRSPIPPHETTTPAIVVRARVFGEADKIVTFLTRDLGKLSGIAKGAKHSKRRFVNVLEPFTHVSLRVRQRANSDLAFIDGCELLDAFHSFARDLRKFAFASYVLELTDRMVRGREAGPETYELVRDALGMLDRTVADVGLLRAFELHLLRVTGYEPALDRCRRCGSLAAARRYVRAAGARRHPLRALPRRRTELRHLARHPRAPDARCSRSRSTRADVSGFALQPGVAAEARALLRSFFAANLTAPLASERLLDEL